MNKAILAVLIAAAMVGLVGWKFCHEREAQSIRAGDGDAASLALAGDVNALKDQVSRLAGELDRLERKIDGRRSRSPDSSALETADAASADGEGSAVAPGSAARSGKASPLPADAKGSDELRTFVAQVIEEERVNRQKAEEQKARDQQREMEEMNQGPYGKLNFKVNSVAKKLNLNDLQKQRYHDLLADYNSRYLDLRNTVDRKDAESMKLYRQNQRTLQEDFEKFAVLGFNKEQSEQYKEMPSWEKSLRDEGIVIETTPILAEIRDGASGATFHLGLAPGAAGSASLSVEAGTGLAPSGAPAPEVAPPPQGEAVIKIPRQR